MRLFWIQVIKGHEHRPLRQYRRKLEAERGIIYDRKLTPLAFNIASYSIGADPRRIRNPKAVAACLSKITRGEDENHFLEKLNRNKKRVFIWLVRKSLYGEPDLENFNGLYKIKELKRTYPYSHVAGQVIGFTNIDNVGLGGIELQYDQRLAGVPGWEVLRFDGLGVSYPSANCSKKEPHHGESIVLTLDIFYQMIAEEELEKTVIKYHAAGGVVIIMDPKSGEILAMANSPSFDPNKFWDYPHRGRNKAITDLFDPGSTFKIATAAAALEEGVKNPQDIIFCEWGKMKIPGGYIHDDKKYGWLTFKQVLEKSSNIGIAKIAQKLGKTRLYQYARAFGFGDFTGIDLPGEAKGILKKPVDWTPNSLIYISIGYGVSVTALQLACAYAAIANGGLLMKPRVAKALLSSNGRLKDVFKPEVVRRVVSKRTAKTLAQLLEGVVQRGTGRKAQISRMRIAGKTGTAKMNGGYIASFVGFLPADDPCLVCLVIINDPKDAHSGGEIAAPVFKNIVKRILDSIG